MTTPNEIPNISDAELEVMKVVWDKHPASAQDIIDSVSRKHDWNFRTVKSLISRLTQKGALDYEKEGKGYLYSPTITRETYLADKSETFLDQMFDGSVMPMLEHFVDSKKLRRQDLKKLSKMLKDQGD